MTAKEYLEQAWKLDLQINAKLEQRDRLRVLAERATSTITAAMVSGTPRRSRMEDAVCEMVDLAHEIEEDIRKLVRLQKAIADSVAAVNPADCRVVLELRYLNFKTWGEIAESMGFEERNVFYIHKKALRLIVVPAP